MNELNRIFFKYRDKNIIMKWTDKDFDSLYEDLVQYFDGDSDEVTEFMGSGQAEPYLKKFNIDLIEPEEYNININQDEFPGQASGDSSMMGPAMEEVKRMQELAGIKEVDFPQLSFTGDQWKTDPNNPNTKIPKVIAFNYPAVKEAIGSENIKMFAKTIGKNTRGRGAGRDKKEFALYISKELKTALDQTTRGRSSRQIEKGKWDLTKKLDAVPSAVKSILKKGTDGGKLMTVGTGPQMYQVSWPVMGQSMKNEDLYWLVPAHMKDYYMDMHESILNEEKTKEADLNIGLVFDTEELRDKAIHKLKSQKLPLVYHAKDAVNIEFPLDKNSKYNKEKIKSIVDKISQQFTKVKFHNSLTEFSNEG
jgi:hypothetical protein